LPVVTNGEDPLVGAAVLCVWGMFHVKRST
jgi:hypothetical protein